MWLKLRVHEAQDHLQHYSWSRDDSLLNYKVSIRDDRPGDSAMTTQVILCCLSKGPTKCFESSLYNMVRVFPSKLQKKKHGVRSGDRGQGSCQLAKLIGKNQLSRSSCSTYDDAINCSWPKKHCSTDPALLKKVLFEYKAILHTWWMWSVIPDVFTSDWKKCSTSCIRDKKALK